MREHLGSLVDAILAIVASLEQSRIPYALGGALALSAWAEPRATRDIDLNLWVAADELPQGFDALESAGVALDRDRAARHASERGMFEGYHGEYRVDVFVPSIPFYDEARARIVRVGFADTTVAVLSPESLAVFKMLFFRAKDLVDLRRLLEIQRQRFDTEFVRRSLVEMLGDDDERIPEWDRLVAESA